MIIRLVRWLALHRFTWVIFHGFIILSINDCFFHAMSICFCLISSWAAFASAHFFFTVFIMINETEIDCLSIVAPDTAFYNFVETSFIRSSAVSISSRAFASCLFNSSHLAERSHLVSSASLALSWSLCCCYSARLDSSFLWFSSSIPPLRHMG